MISAGFVAVRSKQDESHAILLQLQKSVEKLSKLPDREDTKKPGAKPKGDIGGQKFQALREIKNFFSQRNNIFPAWMEAHRENLAQHEDMHNSQVSHTAEWLGEHPSFKAWVNGGIPLLWLRGTEGVGKSFIAHTTVQKLRKTQDEHTCVAYFYFKEEHPYLQSRQNAFASAALQLAESHNKYAEQIAAKIKDGAGKPDNVSTWKRFFLSEFPGGDKSTHRLFLVLDGLDEAYLQDGGVLTQFLSEMKRKNAKISVLATSRPEETPALALLQPSVIDITKQDIKSDIRILVKRRLQTLPRVRKFSPAIKKAITRKVVRQADSMLYVEHMLRRFSYIGRGQAVLEELEKMPSSLYDLYKLLLEECRRDRSEAQYQAMKKMFAWLAFSKRSLSLAEASNLVQLTLSDDTFDIEEEIVGRSSRILELTQARQTDDNDDEDDGYDDGTEDLEDGTVPELGYRNLPLSFQDRSLRQYFRNVSVDTDGTTEFRTPAAAAHLTVFQMCADILIKAAKESDGQISSELALYAVQYWYEHLKEIDVEKSTNESIRQVVTSVYRITQNTNNIARLFERLARHTEIYPDGADDTHVPWFDTLLPWAAKARSLSAESLDVEVMKWALAVKKDNILLPLAKGHFQNWLNANDEWWIPEIYRFAKAALSLVSTFTTVEIFLIGCR